jgi:hypothetical protein
MEITNELFKFTENNYEKKFKSPIWQSHFMFRKKNMFTPTQNLIMLKIANNGPFLPFQLILWKFHKPTKLYCTSNS